MLTVINSILTLDPSIVFSRTAFTGPLDQAFEVDSLPFSLAAQLADPLLSEVTRSFPWNDWEWDP